MASDTSASAPLALPGATGLRTSPKQETPSASKPRVSDADTVAGDTSTSGAEVPDITSPHELTVWVWSCSVKFVILSRADNGDRYNKQVEDVLTRLETSFETMSTQMLDKSECCRLPPHGVYFMLMGLPVQSIAKVEAIGKRIDTVEQSISDLIEGNLTDSIHVSASNEVHAGRTERS